MQKTNEAIAQLIQGELYQAEPTQVIQQLKSLQAASADDLSFYEPTQKNVTEKELQQSNAGVVITTAAFKDSCPNGSIIVENPKVSFAKVATLFEDCFKPPIGIHASAEIGDQSTIAESACIGPGVVVGNGATIGADTVIGANTVIGEQVVIGESTYLAANITIYPKVQIGHRVKIDANTVIGADGFGFVPDEKGVWQRVPQLGTVVIHDDVSIGAGCTIDCGSLTDTTLKQGVKLDDQVHIAHNVVIGEHSLLAGYCAISGSVTIGKHCVLAGGVRTIDNLSIPDNTIITAGSALSKTLKEPGVYGCSIPVAPIAKWRRILGRLNNLDELAKKIIKLEKKIND